jgi:hypothetical protein
VVVVDAGADVDTVKIDVPPLRMLVGAAVSATAGCEGLAVGVGVGVAVGAGVGVGVGVPDEPKAL